MNSFYQNKKFGLEVLFLTIWPSFYRDRFALIMFAPGLNSNCKQFSSELYESEFSHWGFIVCIISLCVGLVDNVLSPLKFCLWRFLKGSTEVKATGRCFTSHPKALLGSYLFGGRLNYLSFGLNAHHWEMVFLNSTERSVLDLNR